MLLGFNNYRPRYGGLVVREDDCSYVWNIPVEKRCAWVKETQDCRIESFIPYVKILFCDIGTENYIKFGLGVIGLFFWILYLFLILGTTADNFFVPNLSVIAHVLHLSENIAGVTILAFGNGAPDIFTSLVANEHEKLVMFTELIGAGVFVTAIIVGTVVIVSPFKVHSQNFVRDTLFYLAATCWISFVVSDLTVYFWEALSCILIYALFIITVIWMQQIQNYEDLRRNLAITYEMKRNQRITGSNTDIKGQIVDGKRPKGLFREFFHDATPVNPEDWKKSGWFMKVILLLRMPFMLILQLSVPTVVETSVNHGWSKLLNCIQIVLTPFLAMTILKLWNVSLYILQIQVPLWAILVSCSLLFGSIVFIITSTGQRPKYHNALAFVGFLKAMLVVYGCAGEVMAVLECLGFTSGISDAMLGITLLAWGNSIGDLISNVTIARKGFARMGLSACFGGPMFNTLMGLGTSYMISTITSTSGMIKIRVGNMAPGCLAFLMISLLTSIIYLNCTGFIARRSYGYLLYSIYGVFMFINILSEIHFIHPLGTDHREDDKK